MSWGERDETFLSLQYSCSQDHLSVLEITTSIKGLKKIQREPVTEKKKKSCEAVIGDQSEIGRIVCSSQSVACDFCGPEAQRDLTPLKEKAVKAPAGVGHKPEECISKSRA